MKSELAIESLSAPTGPGGLFHLASVEVPAQLQMAKPRADRDGPAI